MSDQSEKSDQPDRLVILPPLSQGLGWIEGLNESVVDGRFAAQYQRPSEASSGPEAVRETGAGNPDRFTRPRVS